MGCAHCSHDGTRTPVAYDASEKVGNAQTFSSGVELHVLWILALLDLQYWVVFAAQDVG